jgi:hypothetical protein
MIDRGEITFDATSRCKDLSCCEVGIPDKWIDGLQLSGTSTV